MKDRRLEPMKIYNIRGNIGPRKAIFLDRDPKRPKNKNIILTRFYRGKGVATYVFNDNYHLNENNLGATFKLNHLPEREDQFAEELLQRAGL